MNDTLRELDYFLMRLLAIARTTDPVILDGIIQKMDNTLGKLVYIQWRQKPKEKIWKG